MNKNSIVFIINTMLTGGAAKMMSYVANATCNLFARTTVVSIFDTDTSETLVENIDQKPLGLESKSYMWRIKALSKIRKTISNCNADIVCAFVSDVAVMARLATLGLNVIFASAERGDPYSYSLKWITLEKWAYKKSDVVFFQVNKARDFFDESIIKKSIVIPNPFILKNDIQPYHGVRNKTIVGAGRLEYQKGFDILISAFSEVYKKHPEYQLKIYGDGSLRDALVSQVANLGLSDSVVFPGYIEDLPSALQKEGIYVLSSRFEGIPNSLIEAMAVGIPSVATDCSPGGPAFLTDDGKRGILVPVNDQTALVNAIMKLIENEDLCNRLSEESVSIREVLDEIKIRKMWTDSFQHLCKLAAIR